jgi:hypothetical protein
MNLHFIKEYLINLIDAPEKYSVSRIRELIDGINKHIDKYSSLEDVNTVLSNASKYESMFIELSEEFLMPKTGVHEVKLLKKKISSAQEILCILSAIETYLFIVLTRYNAQNLQMDKNTYKIVQQLRDKKEHYKNEKFAWINILKSATTELQNYMKEKELESKKVD